MSHAERQRIKITFLIQQLMSGAAVAETGFNRSRSTKGFVPLQGRD